MRLLYYLLPALSLAASPVPPVSAQTPDVAPVSAPAVLNSPFVVKPYLQWGNPDVKDAAKRLSVVWHAPDDTSAKWAVEVRRKNKWTTVPKSPAFQTVRVTTIEPHRVYTAELSDLTPGLANPYRVLRNGSPVFEATAMPPKSSGQKSRIVVFGDCGVNSAEQKAIAYQTYRAKPDYVFVTGDIVYGRGRVSEYRTKYFPIYNADNATRYDGVPLLRSTLFVAAPGNHDILHPDFDQSPDGLAYFLYWKQPLNGPALIAGGPNTAPFVGDVNSQNAFKAAAGSAYPRMANFSFDYGDVHWTVLDANPYVNWSDPGMQEWLRQDLKSAQKAKWRFVGFHQPGFNSSVKHFGEQQMRVVAGLFEQGKVDLVLNGHVHNYQRSFPLRFVSAKGQKNEGRKVDGTWTLDKVFDGVKRTKPSGVIYLVTGAGGANLYNPEQQTKPESWQGFTDKFISETHSLTLIDVDGNRLRVQQVDQEGKVVDTFTITK
ncbi:MAG: metallophosphoesterase [Akkermansiaceae bacterium]|nr:metallophosphoesterase [Armatimonadota bacterium]